MKFSTEKKSTLCIYTEVDYGTEKVELHVFIMLDHNICPNCNTAWGFFEMNGFLIKLLIRKPCTQGY